MLSWPFGSYLYQVLSKCQWPLVIYTVTLFYFCGFSDLTLRVCVSVYNGLLIFPRLTSTPRGDKSWVLLSVDVEPRMVGNECVFLVLRVARVRAVRCIVGVFPMFKYSGYLVIECFRTPITQCSLAQLRLSSLLYTFRWWCRPVYLAL